MPLPSHPLALIILSVLGEEYRLLGSSLFKFLHLPATSSISSIQVIPSAPFSQTPSVYVPPLMPQTKFHAHPAPQKIILMNIRLRFQTAPNGSRRY
jgi:hypothetical protein